MSGKPETGSVLPAEVAFHAGFWTLQAAGWVALVVLCGGWTLAALVFKVTFFWPIPAATLGFLVTAPLRPFQRRSWYDSVTVATGTVALVAAGAGLWWAVPSLRPGLGVAALMVTAGVRNRTFRALRESGAIATVRAHRRRRLVPRPPTSPPAPPVFTPTEMRGTAGWRNPEGDLLPVFVSRLPDRDLYGLTVIPSGRRLRGEFTREQMVELIMGGQVTLDRRRVAELTGGTHHQVATLA